jgi:hypothetical protein
MARNTPVTKPVKTAAKRKPIWEQIIEIGEQIPAEELARVPRDGARNLHHYLHGHPKQDPD